MKFEYPMSSQDEKIFYMEKHKRTNRNYLIVFTILYFCLLFSFTKYNLILSLVIYVIFLLTLYALLHITNLIFTNIALKLTNQKNEKYLTYQFTIDEKGIAQKHQNTKITVAWKDVKKIIIRRNYSVIYPKKNNIAFLFRKEVMKDEYDNLIKMLASKKKKQPSLSNHN